MRIYSAHMDSFERAKLARTSNDRSALSRFSYDDSMIVRQAAARNLATKESDRRRLANDTDPRIRMAVARNTSDPRVWRILANDSDVRIRRIVSAKCQDASVLEDMIFDDDEQVRINVVNRLSDTNIIDLMAEDESPEVRKIVASKTKDKDTMELLSNDADASVRKAAEHRLSKSSTLKSSKYKGTGLHQISNIDWSISPYDAESYSQIEDDLDEILDVAISTYADSYWGGSASVQMDSNDYDTLDKLKLIIYDSTGNKYTFDAYADDMLPAATSSTNKQTCVNNVIKWLLSEFGSAK